MTTQDIALGTLTDLFNIDGATSRSLTIKGAALASTTPTVGQALVATAVSGGVITTGWGNTGNTGIFLDMGTPVTYTAFNDLILGTNLTGTIAPNALNRPTLTLNATDQSLLFDNTTVTPITYTPVRDLALGPRLSGTVANNAQGRATLTLTAADQTVYFDATSTTFNPITDIALGNNLVGNVAANTAGRQTLTITGTGGSGGGGGGIAVPAFIQPVWGVVQGAPVPVTRVFGGKAYIFYPLPSNATGGVLNQGDYTIPYVLADTAPDALGYSFTMPNSFGSSVTPATVNITAFSLTGTTATITLATGNAAIFSPGAIITLTGATPRSLDGLYKVLTAPSLTSLTATTLAAQTGTWSSGGAIYIASAPYLTAAWRTNGPTLNSLTFTVDNQVPFITTGFSRFAYVVSEATISATDDPTLAKYQHPTLRIADGSAGSYLKNSIVSTGSAIGIQSSGPMQVTVDVYTGETSAYSNIGTTPYPADAFGSTRWYLMNEISGKATPRVGWALYLAAAYFDVPSTANGWSPGVTQLPRFKNDGTIVLASGFTVGTRSQGWSQSGSTAQSAFVATAYQTWNNSFSDALRIVQASGVNAINFFLATELLPTGVNPSQSDTVIKGLFNDIINPGYRTGDGIGIIEYQPGDFYQRASNNEAPAGNITGFSLNGGADNDGLMEFDLELGNGAGQVTGIYLDAGSTTYTNANVTSGNINLAFPAFGPRGGLILQTTGAAGTENSIAAFITGRGLNQIWILTGLANEPFKITRILVYAGGVTVDIDSLIDWNPEVPVGTVLQYQTYSPTPVTYTTFTDLVLGTNLNGTIANNAVGRPTLTLNTDDFNLTEVLTEGNSANNLNLILNGTGTLQTTAGLLLNGATSGSITLAPPATVTTYSLTMPPAQGAANQILSNNGSGILSWVSPPSLSGITSLQYLFNNGGAFAGSTALTYDSVNSRVSTLAPVATSNLARLVDVEAATAGIRPVDPQGAIVNIAEINIPGSYTNNTGVGTATFTNTIALVISGRTVLQGDYVLLVGQTIQFQNGSYIATTITASSFILTRTSIVPTFGNLWVATATTAQNYGVQYENVTTGTITVGTTAIIYALFGVANSITAQLNLQQVLTNGNTTTLGIAFAQTALGSSNAITLIAPPMLSNARTYQLAMASYPNIAGTPLTCDSTGSITTSSAAINIGNSATDNLTIAAGRIARSSVGSLQVLSGTGVGDAVIFGSSATAAVNNLQINSGSTGNGPTISVAGESTAPLNIAAGPNSAGGTTSVINIGTNRVNYIQVVPAINASTPTIRSQGETNVSLNIAANGTGNISIGTNQTNFIQIQPGSGNPTLAAAGAGNLNLQLAASGVGAISIGTNRANFVQVVPAASGTAPTIQAAGDANASINIAASGTGGVNIGVNRTNYVQVQPGTSSPVIVATGSPTLNLELRGAGAGGVVLGSNQNNYLEVFGGAGNTPPAINSISNSGGNVPIRIIPAGTGDVQIGANLSTYVSLSNNTIAAAGSAGNVALILQGGGTGRVTLGASSQAVAIGPVGIFNVALLAANGMSPTSQSSGSSGQVLTSRGAGATPAWVNPSTTAGLYSRRVGAGIIIPTYTDSQVTFDTQWESTGTHNITYNTNGIFTTSSGGLYLVIGQVAWDRNDIGARVAYFNSSGTPYRLGLTDNNTNTDYPVFQVQVIWNSSANSTLGLTVWHSSNGNLTYGGSFAGLGQYSTWIQFVRFS